MIQVFFKFEFCTLILVFFETILTDISIWIILSLEIDECASNPCQNNGTCTDLLASYVCSCTEEYDGPQCDILKQITCENNPCKAGSSCVDGASKSNKCFKIQSTWWKYS